MSIKLHLYKDFCTNAHFCSLGLNTMGNINIFIYSIFPMVLFQNFELAEKVEEKYKFHFSLFVTTINLS